MHLKGMPVCLNAGPNHAQSCDCYVVLRAGEADRQEDTCQIDPHGKVTVVRER